MFMLSSSCTQRGVFGVLSSKGMVSDETFTGAPPSTIPTPGHRMIRISQGSKLPKTIAGTRSSHSRGYFLGGVTACPHLLNLIHPNLRPLLLPLLRHRQVQPSFPGVEERCPCVLGRLD